MGRDSKYASLHIRVAYGSSKLEGGGAGGSGSYERGNGSGAGAGAGRYLDRDSQSFLT